MAKQRKTTKSIQNRRARFDYELDDSFVVGIELNGREVRSLRLGRGYLRGAYVIIRDDELWLINSTIGGGAGMSISESEQTRSRRLLAKRREIEQLGSAKQAGRTIVPMEIMTGGRFIKLRIALGKGKKRYDKRQTIKSREESRRLKVLKYR